MARRSDLEDEERRRIAAEKWEKEFGPEASPRKKFWMVAIFVVAFFGLIAAVFNSATF